MIALEHLSLTLGVFSLYDISLRVGKGEYLIVLGPSGAGKTVLLETIAGLRSPSGGTILIEGRDVSSIPPEQRGIAIVYQDYSLFPHMTAYENIAYSLRLRRLMESEIGSRVQELLARFEIPDLPGRYPSSLSGGEQQRVALARALASDPSVLLLDEPFAALDPRTQEECMRILLKVKQEQGLTVVQVSHAREEAFALGDRAALIIDGRIVQTGPVEEIFHHPRTPAAARYAGIENILQGTVVWSDSTSLVMEPGDQQVTVQGSAPTGSTVTACIPGDRITLVRKPRVTIDTSVNAIPATVADILRMEHGVKVRLDGTIPLKVSVSDISQHPYSPGEQVTTLFSPGDVQLLEPDP
jgi:ABC-type Fe3+/spermidine/putrescine transport system ATPase subunit